MPTNLVPDKSIFTSAPDGILDTRELIFKRPKKFAIPLILKSYRLLSIIFTSDPELKIILKNCNTDNLANNIWLTRTKIKPPIKPINRFVYKVNIIVAIKKTSCSGPLEYTCLNTVGDANLNPV